MSPSAGSPGDSVNVSTAAQAKVRVVASPLRDGRRAGAMCFVVKEDASIVRPNDGICDSVNVIAAWENNGWLASTQQLGSHPAPAAEE